MTKKGYNYWYGNFEKAYTLLERDKTQVEVQHLNQWYLVTKSHCGSWGMDLNPKGFIPLVHLTDLNFYFRSPIQTQEKEPNKQEKESYKRDTFKIVYNPYTTACDINREEYRTIGQLMKTERASEGYFVITKRH